MKRVLLVEDDPDLLDALERQFREVAPDWEVASARDGVAALELALAHKPHVIVLDLMVPRMRGLEMLRRLRKYDWGKDIRVMVLTNFDEGAYLQEAISLNVSDFMVKAHYSLEDVVKRVRSIADERVRSADFA